MGRSVHAGYNVNLDNVMKEQEFANQSGYVLCTVHLSAFLTCNFGKGIRKGGACTGFSQEGGGGLS